MTAPGAGSVVRLVAARELRQRLAAPSFWILTGLLVVAILAGGVISRVAGEDGPGRVTIGIAGTPSDGLARAVDAVAGLVERDVEVVDVDEADARRAIEDGDVDVAVVLSEREVVFDETVDAEVSALVQQAWASSQVRVALGAQGLSDEEIAAALAPAPLSVVTLEEGDDASDGLATGVGSASTILLFVAVSAFGGYVLTGVVEEKSTAVVELLLVRARAKHLLAGKVIGIGGAALAQMALAVLASLAALAISGVDVPGELWVSLPWVLVWFLAGYAFYSTLFAVAGALVSRQEDAQAAAAPITSVLVIAYLLGFAFGSDPESTASRVLSVLPPMAPMLMPMRMAAGGASVLEIASALALLLGSVLVAWKVTGRIYEQVVLQRGTRISWRAAASLLRRAP